MSTGPTINATSTVPLIITPGDLPPATTLPSQTPPSSKESPSPLPSISTGAIVGIAVGAVVILMVLGLLCICCKKKKRRRDEERCAREQSDRERSQHQSRQLSQSEIFSLTFQILFLNFFWYDLQFYFTIFFYFLMLILRMVFSFCFDIFLLFIA